MISLEKADNGNLKISVKEIAQYIRFVATESHSMRSHLRNIKLSLDQHKTSMQK
jgi:Ni,Fe-hydrogenase III large subunit